jgi:predicted molibdopterin-dependent oxidoreductase YjgC
MFKFLSLLNFYCFNNTVVIRGALTSKPYAFVARSWEFKSVNTIDFFDSLGASIRVDIRGDKIIRILPRLNESTNDEWISDKIRFCSDGLRLQRIDTPLMFSPLHNNLKTISWFRLVSIVFKLLKNNIFFKNNIFSSFSTIPFRLFEGIFFNLTSAFS